MAVIFAQLIVNEKDYGPHAFVVPIRDKRTGRPFNGVMLGDCGQKIGLEGIDNGFIIFNRYRIPKDNLLNKFSSIDSEGNV